MASEHLVHFFDDTAARVDAVSTFVADALSRNGTALVVATPAHWKDVSAVLDRRGLIAEHGSRLVVLEARTTLTLLLRQGRVEPELFQKVVEPLVAELSAASGGGPLAIYGEMVDILAQEGRFDSVTVLERCWNDLLARERATLLCGYSSAHFAVGDRAHFTEVCQAHTRVHTGGPDTLGGWLVTMVS